MERMTCKKPERLWRLCAGLILIFTAACNLPSSTQPSPPTSTRQPTLTPTTTPSPTESPTATLLPTPAPESPVQSKWELWSQGQTTLRGANIWQALVVPELDGPEFKGSAHIGPPFIQADFDRLAALGANLVVISYPGLFTEKPPFVPDLAAAENLDRLLEMISTADMFAVIAFRTGPGRSEYTICCAGEDWAEGYFNDSMWQDMAAQDAWVEMWKFTAERYRNNPIVVGYELMVEPNSNGVVFDVWEPEEFYPRYAGTSYDWNQLYPRLVTAIRQVDSDTPILIDPMSYGDIEWLPAMQVLEAEKIVYSPHQYSPHPYTHQWEQEGNTYPGFFDLDYDGSRETFDLDWLRGLTGMIRDFRDQYHAVVAVSEYGVMRSVPDAPAYLHDLMGLFEELGVNYSMWEWSVSYPPFVDEVNAFTFQYGPDLNNIMEVENPLMDVILAYWQRNSLRPSNVTWTAP